MSSSRYSWLACATFAVGCSFGRAPTGTDGLPRACEGAGGAACEPLPAEDIIACDSRDGALSLPLGKRCIPVVVSPRGWEHTGLESDGEGAPAGACGDVLRIEAKTVRHVYSVLEIHAVGERLVSRDPAPASYQALLSPDCEVAWFWEPGGGWLFFKVEGAWARRWFDELGAVVRAGFSPDGRTLFTAGIDPGSAGREALLLLCTIDTTVGELGACQRIPAPAEELSGVAVSSAGAFVQLSWFAEVAGRLEGYSRLFGFSAGGLSLRSTGDGEHASHVRLSASGGARPLLLVVSEHAGTWIYDARDLKLLARWPREGISGNAETAGASPSPDGAYVALPEPYGRCVTFIRSRDLRRLGRLCGKELEGAGRVIWREDAVLVETFPLPYE